MPQKLSFMQFWQMAKPHRHRQTNGAMAPQHWHFFHRVRLFRFLPVVAAPILWLRVCDDWLAVQDTMPVVLSVSMVHANSSLRRCRSET